MQNRAFEDIISSCVRPSRYVGNELNSVHRDWDEAQLRVALVFPDTYEVGQSGLGLKILYSLMAEDPSILVERAFAPWADAEDILRKSNTPLPTLESGRPLQEFDLLGITLPYELTYTNVLNILEMAHFPLFAARRDDSYPLVAGGGSCVFNPEPMADFFDFFVLGDGEEVIQEIAEVLKSWKGRGGTKSEALEELAKLEGIYVPRFYDCPHGSVTPTPLDPGYPQSIKKRIVRNFDRAWYPTSPVIPFVETVHDRIMLEICRGCTRGCRFCQAGMIYRPVRERTLDTLLALAGESIGNTGYEEISLTSLSCSDYSRIRDLSYALLKEYASEYLEISVPSLRIDFFSLELAKLVQRFRRTTLTFAPEVGTQKMRNVINKGGSEEDVIKTMTAVRQEGWKSVKLYFLIGLPEENDDDIAGIVKLVWKILQATGLRLNISLASFIPKAWTVFQWDPFQDIAVLREKHALIRRQLRHGKIELSWHNPEASFIEAVFARGDRQLSHVLLHARKLGARFDGWHDHFNFSLWMKAFEEARIDPHHYTGKREFTDSLPWDHLGGWVRKGFLIEDRSRASEGTLCSDCRTGACNECGVCGSSAAREVLPLQEPVEAPHIPEEAQVTGTVSRVRIKYAKEEPLRLISHLDLIRVIQRAVRRAKIPICYTAGFHPRMRISFGPALSLGFTSISEWMDLDLRMAIGSEEIMRRLNDTLPRGLEILEAREIPTGSEPLSGIIHLAEYAMEVTFRNPVTEDKVKSVISSVMASPRITVDRKEKQIDIRPHIKQISPVKVEDFAATLLVSLGISSEASAKPGDIFRLLEENGLAPGDLKVQRRGLYTRKGTEWISP